MLDREPHLAVCLNLLQHWLEAWQQRNQRGEEGEPNGTEKLQWSDRDGEGGGLEEKDQLREERESTELSRCGAHNGCEQSLAVYADAGGAADALTPDWLFVMPAPHRSISGETG